MMCVMESFWEDPGQDSNKNSTMVLSKRVKMLRWHKARGAVSVHTLVDCVEIAF